MAAIGFAYIENTLLDEIADIAGLTSQRRYFPHDAVSLHYGLVLFGLTCEKAIVLAINVLLPYRIKSAQNGELMNRPHRPKVPPTHFALIDDIVEVNAGGSTHRYIVLDCITCEAAQQLKNSTWEALEQIKGPLSSSMVLSVQLDAFRRVLPDLPLDGQWLSFRLAERSNNVADEERAVTASFVHLSGTTEVDAVPRFFLSGIAPVSSPLKKLAMLTGLNSRKQEIVDALDAMDHGFAQDERNVVVYDIGQGSATALVDIIGRPIIHFDLGWPTSLNSATRPKDPPYLFEPDSCLNCMDWAPGPAPVILSHWDFDHWAYAVQNDNYNYGKKAANIKFKPAALARPWILPKPPRIKSTKGLGPTHMRLLAALPQRIMWPNSLHSASFFAGTLTRTDPKKAPTDRNNQGLAWFVTRSNSTDAILLPGDISFDHLRMPRRITITGLLAPHHGGNVSGIATSLPKASVAARTLVLSVGKGNVHGHPIASIMGHYAAAGWSKHIKTSTRRVLPFSSPQENGSVLMQLSRSDLMPLYWCTCIHNGNLIPTQLS